MRYGEKLAGESSPAIVYYGRHITYSELIDEIHAYVAGLRSRGVRPGDHVTIFLLNILQCVVAEYAVILIGAIGNMEHPLSTTEENGYAVDLITSKYVLTCEINENICSGMDVEIIRCRTPAYFPRTPKGYLMA